MGPVFRSSATRFRRFVARIERSEIRERRFRSTAAPGFRSAQPGLRRKMKEAERRQTQGHNRRILRCGARSFGARTLVGVPPRLSSRGVFHPQGQLQARLPGTWSERALPAFACPSPGMHLPSRSSCREADTQAAREQHAKPPAGTAPAPPFGLPPEGVLQESGINSYVIGVVTDVNIIVTAIATIFLHLPLEGEGRRPKGGGLG